jgi:hypothetical protein
MLGNAGGGTRPTKIAFGAPTGTPYAGPVRNIFERSAEAIAALQPAQQARHGY